MKVELQFFLHQPDIVIDPMVANRGRAASSVKAAAAAGGAAGPPLQSLLIGQTWAAG